MAAPPVSVVIAVRDGALYLDQAIASLRRQSFADFEIVAIDDGSTDATPAILARHSALDRRIRIESGPVAGLVAALNRGLERARGDLVARLDADDVARPQRLARQVAFLAAHPSVAAVGSAWEVIDAAGSVLKRSKPPLTPAAIRAVLPRTNCLLHPGVTMRRAAVLAAGGYREAFRHCEDYDLWLRLVERWDLANLPEALLGYRRHAAALSLRAVRQQALAELAARAAFRRRAAGLPEGLDPARPVDRAALAGLGLDDRAIDRHLRKRLLVAARTARRAGAPDRARELVGEAVTLIGDAPLRERLDFLLRRLKVRF